MTITKKGKYYFGENHEDLIQELKRYSEAIYPIDHFKTSKCHCGSEEFSFLINEDPGVVVRYCTQCDDEFAMGDAEEYFDEVEELFDVECQCGGKEFVAVSGISLYENSEDLRWFYLGLLCKKCQCMGCYADWKNEFIGFKKFLKNL